MIHTLGHAAVVKSIMFASYPNMAHVQKVSISTSQFPSAMAPTVRRSGVGPLFVQTGTLSSCSIEQARTPRAARCKTMPRHECVKPLITKAEIFTRLPSTTRVSRVPSNKPEPGWTFSRVFSRVSSMEDVSFTTSEPRGRQVHTDIDLSLAFERESSCLVERVSCVQSQRLQRGTSITTDAADMPSMIHRAPSTEILGDFQTLKIQGSDRETLDRWDPRLFDPRSSLFLFQDIERYDAQHEHPRVGARL